jgi:cell division protein FtsZ
MVGDIMSNMGRAIMGTGCAKGEGRARLAAEMAVSSPLLDNISVEGAMAVLVNIVGGADLRMKEMEEATALIYEQAHEDANIIWGASIDESMGETVKVTVIATGFDHLAGEHGFEQAAARPTIVSVPQQIATSRVAQQQMQTNRPAPPSEDASHLIASRRPAVPHRTPVAVTASRTQPTAFPPTSEMDWDIPTYTRRNGR